MKTIGYDIVDFHSHILPGADHGSDSVQTSIQQLTLAKNASVSRIIATPHFYPHRHSVEGFLERRDRCFEELAAVNVTGDYPDVIKGAEVLVCDGIERLDGVEKLCIGRSNTILLELPFADFSSRYVEGAAGLIERGFEVVLAHADRYNPTDIGEMLDTGAKIQLNATALLGFFIPKHIKSWINDGTVIALGSDIHGAPEKAYAFFTKAISRLGEYAGYVKAQSDRIWKKAKY
jgi:protein-tyrosine phosphatase